MIVSITVAASHTDRRDDSALELETATRAAHLAIVHGVTRGETHVLADGETHVGRGGGGIELADAGVSREHVTIARDDVRWRITDRGSRNGGFLDGAPFAPGATLTLVDGAVIRLGDALAVFRLGAPAASSPHPEASFPGRSLPAATIRRRLEQLASESGHVLIWGETGTGKERAAHHFTRAGLPFISQNCAELSRDLARSELFGHVRGAFSGAATSKPGLVDAATDGVLFLDEIGELPLDVQGELLRFLEDGSYRPIGATDLRTSAARVVAATNVDLDDAVRAHAFRRDLLARLRATNTPLWLPPLRRRREDILGWAQRFIGEVLEVPPADAFSAGAAECLLVYPWLENLRELRAAVRELARGRFPIEASALPERLTRHRRECRAVRPDADEPIPPADAIEPTVDAIEQALREHHGKMLPASEHLGIDRRKLYRLCEKHAIDFEAFRR